MGVPLRVMLVRLAHERGRRNLARKRKREEARRRRSGFFSDVPAQEVEELWEKIEAKRVEEIERRTSAA